MTQAAALSDNAKGASKASLDRTPAPSGSRNGPPGAYIPLKVHVHGRGQITKSFALLHEVTVSRPREMIGQYWNSVFSEEGEHFEPRLDRLLGIRVIEKFHAWIL